MKYGDMIFFLMIICLLSLISCRSNANDSARDTPMVTVEPTSTPSAVSTPEPTPEIASSQKNNAWVEAYADFLMQGDYPPTFILFDADFNGIPELFLYTSGYGANTWVISILRYSEQGLEQIDIANSIPAVFELYKDKQTGDARWMTVMDSFRSSYSYYHYAWEWIDFNDFTDIRTELFFSWDFEGILTDADSDEYELIYYLYENTDEIKEVEYEEIERRQQELFSRYELIETQMLYAYSDDFVINSSSAEISDNLDRGLIVEFLSQWE